MINNEVLLEISTDFFEISFLGNQPSSFNLLGLNDVYISESSVSDFQILFEESYPIVRIKNSRGINLNKVNVYRSEIGGYLPLFYENTNYQFVLKSKDKSEYSIKFNGSDAHNPEKDLIVNDLITGTINFRENVGISTLSIIKNHKILSVIEFSVFSLKLDFLTDRLIMLKQLQEINNSIVLNIFKSTSSNYDYSKEKKNTKIEWLNNYIRLIDRLRNNLKRIEKKSSNHLERTIVDYPTNKIKNIDNTINDFLIKHGKRELKNRKYLQLLGNVVTHKTDELGYIKFLTENLQKKLKVLFDHIEINQGDYYRRIKQEEEFLLLKKKNISFKSELKKPFWSSITSLNNLKNRTKFNFQKEYLTYERNIKLLNRVLDIENVGSNNISVMSMDKLYESWLYVKIIEIITNIKGIQDDVKIGFYEDFFRKYLAAGISNAISIDELIVYNNKEYNKNTSRFFSPLIPQKPDFSIELPHNNQLVIFDSKYKIQLKAMINKKWRILKNTDLISLNKDLVEELVIDRKDEDINTMHRYRDAIRMRKKASTEQSQVIKYAIILYPYKPNSSIKEHYIKEYQSIYDYGIGAIPVAPGVKDDNWMEEIDKGNIIPTQENVEQIRILAKIIKDSILEKEKKI